MPAAQAYRAPSTPLVSALADGLVGREPGSERLNTVAEVYLEIAGMDSADVLSALDATAAPYLVRRQT